MFVFLQWPTHVCQRASDNYKPAAKFFSDTNVSSSVHLPTKFHVISDICNSSCSSPPPLAPLSVSRDEIIPVKIEVIDNAQHQQEQETVWEQFEVVEVAEEEGEGKDEYKLLKRVADRKYYEEHKEAIKEKRRIQNKKDDHREHKKFMNRKRYSELKDNTTKFVDVRHQSVCKIGICATFVHPLKLKKKNSNQKYYEKHKEKIKAKRRPQRLDEDHKAHKCFMNKKRYFELKQHYTFEDADHQMMCNIGICAGYVPTLMPRAKIKNQEYL